MAEDKKIEVTISVTSDDKELKEYIKNIAQAADKTKNFSEKSSEAAEKTNDLSQTMNNWARTIGSLYALEKITSFLSTQAIEAAKEERALNGLRWEIKQWQESLENASDKIEEFAKAMGEVGMEDDLVYQSLRELMPLTRDLAQSQSAVTLAWQISTATGRDYNAVLEVVRDLVAGRERGLITAMKQFGVEATTTQEALDKMQKTFLDGKTIITDHLTDINRLSNAWKNFKETIGDWVLSATDFWYPKIAWFWNNVALLPLKASEAMLKAMMTITPTDTAFYRNMQASLNDLQSTIESLSLTTSKAETKLQDYNIALKVVKEGEVEHNKVKQQSIEKTKEQISLLEKYRRELIEAIENIESHEKKRGKIAYPEIKPISDKYSDDIAEMTNKINEVFAAGLDKANAYTLSSTLATIKKLETMWKQDSANIIALKRKEAQVLSYLAIDVAENVTNSLQTIMTAAGAHSKLIFRLQQALAIAKTIMNTQEAIMQVHATYPPPYSYVLSAIELATGLAALATIQAQKPPTVSARQGFDIPAGVNPVVQAHEKEMILPADLADKIRSVTNNFGGNNIFNINALTGAYGLRAAKASLVVGEKKYSHYRVGN